MRGVYMRGGVYEGGVYEGVYMRGGGVYHKILILLTGGVVVHTGNQ